MGKALDLGEGVFEFNQLNIESVWTPNDEPCVKQRSRTRNVAHPVFYFLADKQSLPRWCSPLQIYSPLQGVCSKSIRDGARGTQISRLAELL